MGADIQAISPLCPELPEQVKSDNDGRGEVALEKGFCIRRSTDGLLEKSEKSVT